ncbi:MAG: hypothetical protein PF508_19105, partial [Spirochaeta sp.]|nr:hypothetical protein [Spirochaeta sp.]
GFYYGTFLLSGPVDDESSQGSDLAPWLMNAVQFEYGLSARVAMGVVDVVGDYGRRSYHPLRRGFADPAADILRAGLLVPGRSVGAGVVSGALRVRWARLFDFWGSDIPDPRGTWALQPVVEYRHPLLARPGLAIDAFGLTMADLLLLNNGSPDSDLAGQIGVALSGGRSTRGGVGRIEGFFDVYRSTDTEEREERRTPVTLVGLGGRIVFEF